MKVLLAVVLLAALLLLLWWVDPRLPAGLAPQDLDGSGRLSREQAGPLLRRHFDAIDRDGSGELDGRELRRHILRDGLRGRTRTVAVPAFPEQRRGEALRDWLQSPLQSGRLFGVAMVVLRDGEVVFDHHAGDVDPGTAQPVGSAGMWLAAAMLACLDERGDLDLQGDLRGLDRQLGGGWGDMPLLDILSHTAGAAAVAGMHFSPDTSLETAARAVMARHPPVGGQQELRFGAAGLQVLAGLVEGRHERSWRRLFVECLGWPLSLHSASFGHPVTGPRSQGFHSPGLGLHLSVKDYARFLAMLQQEGRFDGVRVLDRRSLEQLERDRADALPRADLPRWADSRWGHTAGAWCEHRDEQERCRRLLVLGEYGTLAWLDRDRRLAGVIHVLDDLPRVRAWLFATRELAEQTHF